MLALTAISPHYDDSEPVPVGLVPAPMELINRYVAWARDRFVKTSGNGYPEVYQQTLRRRFTREWHARIEADHGVVVDPTTGVYVWRSQLGVFSIGRHKSRVVKAPRPPKPNRIHRKRCGKCSRPAVHGRALCTKHLERDRLRQLTKAKRAAGAQRKRAARAAKPKRAEALKAVE